MILPIVLIISFTLTVLLALIVKVSVNSDDDNIRQLLFLYMGLFASALYYTILSFADHWRTIGTPHAVLYIEKKGINERLSLFSCGEILWSEITGVEIKQALRTDFLVIHVLDPDAVIARQSKWKQRTLRGFQKKLGSPVVIPQNRIQEYVADLRIIIADHLQ